MTHARWYEPRQRPTISSTGAGIRNCNDCKATCHKCVYSFEHGADSGVGPHIAQRRLRPSNPIPERIRKRLG